MTHWILQLRDAFTLAFTKFRTRRVRTILTLISTSILSLILVVVSSLLTGFMKIANGTPQSALTDLHLAQTAPFISGDQINVTSGPKPQDGLQKFRSDNGNVLGLRDVYVDATPDSNGVSSGTLDILKPEDADPSDVGGFDQTLSARSTALIQPFVGDGQTLNWNPGEPVPVIVSTRIVSDAHAKELDAINDPQKRFDRRHDLQQALLGKTGTLTLTNQFSLSIPKGVTEQQYYKQFPEQQPKTLPVKVVGFAPTATGLTEAGYSVSGFSVPFEITDKSPSAKSLFTELNTLYPSFDTKQHRNTYVSKTPGASVYADVIEANKRYFKAFNRAYHIAVIVMLVLMAIPMAATLSKILADSQRETGVFRAIGARNRNVISIYSLYSLMVVVSAFVISLVIGLSVCALLNARYAKSIALGIADVGDTIVKVNLVQVNPGQLATILLGLVAGSIVGAAFPMYRSLRRDPIKALRDE